MVLSFWDPSGWSWCQRVDKSCCLWHLLILNLDVLRAACTEQLNTTFARGQLSSPFPQKVQLSGTNVPLSHPPSIWSLSHVWRHFYLVRSCTTNIEKKPVFSFLCGFSLYWTSRESLCYVQLSGKISPSSTIIFHKCKCGITRIFHIWRKRQIYLLYTQIFHLLKEIFVIQNDAMVLCN